MILYPKYVVWFYTHLAKIFAWKGSSYVIYYSDYWVVSISLQPVAKSESSWEVRSLKFRVSGKAQLFMLLYYKVKCWENIGRLIKGQDLWLFSLQNILWRQTLANTFSIFVFAQTWFMRNDRYLEISLRITEQSNQPWNRIQPA